MRIRDFVLLGLVLLWLAAVLFLRLKKKKGGCPAGCCGCGQGDCNACRKRGQTKGKT